MYDPITKDKAQWIEDARPGSQRWQAQPTLPLPDALLSWLVDLRLLRHVPFHYLVPDPRLLPPESARVFYVDPTFTDRLVDGALAAGNLGTWDQGLSAAAMAGVRAQVDAALEARAGLAKGAWKSTTVTGLLLRSGAARRWPGMEVRAYADSGGASRITTLRQERLAEGVLIALFAGVPARIELQEPAEGTHFGFNLEPGGGLTLNPRSDGDQLLPKIPTPLRGAAYLRVVDLAALSAGIDGALGPGIQTIDSARLALSLQRVPYVQVLRGGSSGDGIWLDGLVTQLKAALQGGG